MPSEFDPAAPRSMDNPRNDGVGLGTAELRSIGKEISQLTDEFRELAQLEIRLAKTELVEHAKTAAISTGWGFVAAVMAVMTLTFLLATFGFVMANFMPAWAAALATAVLAALITGGLATMAINGFKDVASRPKRSIRSLQEALQWLKNPLRSNVKSKPSVS